MAEPALSSVISARAKRQCVGAMYLSGAQLEFYVSNDSYNVCSCGLLTYIDFWLSGSAYLKLDRADFL